MSVTFSPSSSPIPEHTPPPFPSPPAGAVGGHFHPHSGGGLPAIVSDPLPPPSRGEKKEQNLEPMESAYLFLLSYHTVPGRYRDSSPPTLTLSVLAASGPVSR